MDENNINEFLDVIEAQYTVYDRIFMFSPQDFLANADIFDRECEVQDLNVPISLLEMMETIETEEETDER